MMDPKLLNVHHMFFSGTNLGCSKDLCIYGAQASISKLTSSKHFPPKIMITNLHKLIRP